MLWTYFARRVEESILAGVQRALARLEGDGGEETETEFAGAVTTLQVKILAAPKAKADEEATGTRRKAKAAA